MFQQSERKSSSESNEELLSVKSTTSSLCKLIIQFSYDVLVLDSNAVSQFMYHLLNHFTVSKIFNPPHWEPWKNLEQRKL